MANQNESTSNQQQTKDGGKTDQSQKNSSQGDNQRSTNQQDSKKNPSQTDNKTEHKGGSGDQQNEKRR